jgi:membrane-associated phospholipid phosphatase
MPDAPATAPAVSAIMPRHARAWLVPALMIVAGLAFFLAVVADLRHNGKLAQADKVLAPYIFERVHPWLMILAGGVSRTGGSDVLVGAALCFLPWLIRRRQWRVIAVMIIGLLGSADMNAVLKMYFAIPRPAEHTFYVFKPDQGLHTFPSGHTMGAAMLAGLLALGWMHLKPCTRRRRWAIGFLAWTWTCLVAASLVYVGVHYLTDVLASLGLSLAWLGVLRAALPPRAYDEPQPRP